MHLLARTGEPDVFEQLRELAVRDGMREDVKTALMDTLYRLDQNNPKAEEPVDAELVPEELREAPDVDYIATNVEQNSELHLGPEVQTHLDEFEF